MTKRTYPLFTSIVDDINVCTLYEDVNKARTVNSINSFKRGTAQLAMVLPLNRESFKQADIDLLCQQLQQIMRKSHE